MKKLAFICTGNTCRSPMAEAMMKKLLLVVICLALLLVFWQCNRYDPPGNDSDTPTTAPSEPSTVPSEPTEAPTEPSTPPEPVYAYQPAEIPENYWPVLNNMQQYQMFGQKALLDSFVFTENRVKITHCTDVNYTLLTTDKNEIMLAISDGFDTLVLYETGGTVYGRSYSFRLLYDLCTNGTYSWNYSNAEGHHYGQSRIYFAADGLKNETLWQISNDGQENAKYLIGGREVTQEKLQEYIAANKGTEVSWAPIYRYPTVVEDITKLSLDRAYLYAVKQFEKYPESHRDIGELQPETGEIIEMDGKYYQSYVASDADIRFVFITQPEFPFPLNSTWDWFTVGTADDYSLERLDKLDQSN